MLEKKQQKFEVVYRNKWMFLPGWQLSYHVERWTRRTVHLKWFNWSWVTSCHRWASTSILMSAISDIDICYYDIGDKYGRLKNVILISEVFRYQHQNPGPLEIIGKYYTSELRYFFLIKRMSDIRYRIKLYSNIRYNVGLCSLSPISLITDIRLSSHLCQLFTVAALQADKAG